MKKVMKWLFIIAAMVLACATSFGQGTIVWNINNDPGQETPPPLGIWTASGPIIVTGVPTDFSTDSGSSLSSETLPDFNETTSSEPITLISDETGIDFSSISDNSDSSDFLITAAPEPSPFAIVLLSVISLVLASKFRQHFRFLSTRS